MSHEQMLLGKYHKMVDKANNEAWKVEELEKRNKELLVSKNALYKEVEELKAENEKLKETNNVRFDKIKEMENEVGVSKLVHHQNLGLLEDNKKLKELTDGIMNEPGTGHILGCNAYEKFCQAMSELNYDEKWIGELMLEEAENDTEEDILKAEIKKLKECLLSYWSDGKLGNHAAWTPPATWQIMLDEAGAKEPRTKS